MRRFGLCVPFVVLALIGCGSSGGGGTGGAGGAGGKGGAGAKGGSSGTGGGAGAGGHAGTAGGGSGGGNAGASGNAGAGGGSAGASGNAGAGGGSAGASGNAGAGGGSAGTSGNAGAGGHAGAGGGSAGASGNAGAGGGNAGTNGSAGNGGAGGALAACGDATGQGDQCSTITGAATGPCVAVTMSSATAPTAAGGAVANGTYELTSATFYGTLPDAGSGDGDFSTRRETFVVSGATATSFTLEQFRVDGTQDSSEEGTVAISSGTMAVTYTPTCPPPGDGGNKGGSAGYSSTSTTFSLIMTKGSGVLVRVYTKTS